MVYKRFRINCIIRIALIGATIYLFFYFLVRTTYYVSTIIIASIILYQIYALIYYVEKTNRDLTRFLEAIKYSDFTQTFTGAGLGSSFDELKKAFSEVMDDFRQARAEKEEHFRYLQTIVQHVAIGLVAFQPNGEIELVNTAAKRLFRVPRLKNINALKNFSESLVATLFRLRPGEKALVKVNKNNEILQLALYATEFRLRGRKFTLVSVQNIYSELEEKEIEAWQNLIRVLTHEIMNSVTPISSLAATANDLLTKSNSNQMLNKEIQLDTLSDIGNALQTIQRRSEGLLHFVDAYRKLTRIPTPDFQIFTISELFQRVQHLLQAQLDEKSISFNTIIEPETLELTADSELIEQVLINLLLNAIEAVANQPDAEINLHARFDPSSHIIIQIADNGPGMTEDVLEKIFIPFFTTKKSGSGIGLSLSRQIMRLHRGTISVQSKPHIETVFTLKF